MTPYQTCMLHLTGIALHTHALSPLSVPRMLNDVFTNTGGMHNGWAARLQQAMQLGAYIQSIPGDCQHALHVSRGMHCSQAVVSHMRSAAMHSLGLQMAPANLLPRPRHTGSPCGRSPGTWTPRTKAPSALRSRLCIASQQRAQRRHLRRRCRARLTAARASARPAARAP